MTRCIPILLALAPACYAPLHEGTPDPPQPSIRMLIAAAETRHRLPDGLLKGVAWSESRMRPDVFHVETNGTTSTGVFGLNSFSFPGSESWSVEQQADAAGEYLSRLLEQCQQNQRCAQQAYRTGRIRRQP